MTAAIVLQTSKKISDYLTKFLNEEINQPFKKRVITSIWRREVIDPYRDRNYEHIREIIGGGQAKFDMPFNGLTPKERVLVYCYDGGFEQHLISQMYIFEKHTTIFKQYISKPNQAIFIDFGCGPMTSGIAISRYYAESISADREPLTINYIGIDSSIAMLEKAQDFCKYPDLFHDNSSFDFCQSTSNPINIPEYIDVHISDKSVIFLNFSYFFASDTIEVEKIAQTVQNLSVEYSNPIILLFQNPPGYQLNKKWHQFTALLSNFSSVVGDSVNDTVSYRKHTGISPSVRDTKLYYDIRVRGGRV